MKKAKIINRNSIEVIDYESEIKKIESEYKADIEFGLSIEKADKNKQSALEILKQYVEFSPSDFSQELGEFDSVMPYYIQKGDIIYQKWELNKGSEAKILQKINDLKNKLSSSDYKMMKCYEASLIGATSPYDEKTLISERQSIRDEINRLEELLTPEK